MNGIHEARGSTPLSSTIQIFYKKPCGNAWLFFLG